MFDMRSCSQYIYPGGIVVRATTIAPCRSAIRLPRTHEALVGFSMPLAIYHSTERLKVNPTPVIREEQKNDETYRRTNGHPYARGGLRR
jgi:hypothetical protein